MKKIISLVLLLIILLSISAVAQQIIRVYIDGNELYCPVPPFEKMGCTLVPLRAIFEGLGATVQWDEATQTVISNKGNVTVQLTVNSKTAYVNGQARTLALPAMIINGSTMVPLRFISEAFGADVKWDGPTQSIFIERQKRQTPAPETVIYSIIHNGNQILYPGDVLKVTLTGTPGGNATFDIQGIVTGIAMDEITSGKYIGTYTIQSNDKGKNLLLIGHLSKGNYIPSSRQADQKITISQQSNNPRAKTVIYSITHNGTQALVPGDVFIVTLTGTPGGNATFDISGIVTGIAMSEVSDGKYKGTYTIKSIDKGKNLPITGYLFKDDYALSTAQADQKITIKHPENPKAKTVIYAITHNGTQILAPGDVLTVTLTGTSGGNATFDISGIVTGVAMNEVSDGKYKGSYTIKSSDKGKNLSVKGYLVKDNYTLSSIQAEQKISIKHQ